MVLVLQECIKFSAIAWTLETHPDHVAGWPYWTPCKKAFTQTVFGEKLANKNTKRAALLKEIQLSISAIVWRPCCNTEVACFSGHY